MLYALSSSQKQDFLIYDTRICQSAVQYDNEAHSGALCWSVIGGFNCVCLLGGPSAICSAIGLCIAAEHEGLCWGRKDMLLNLDNF